MNETKQVPIQEVTIAGIKLVFVAAKQKDEYCIGIIPVGRDLDMGEMKMLDKYLVAEGFKEFNDNIVYNLNNDIEDEVAIAIKNELSKN